MKTPKKGTTMKNVSTKIFAATAVAGIMVLFGAMSASADSSRYSIDDNHGSFVQFTSVNEHLTVYDKKSDGFGADAEVQYNAGGGGYCSNEQGYNTSGTCLISAGQAFSFRACLEDNSRDSVFSCSAPSNDHS